MRHFLIAALAAVTAICAPIGQAYAFVVFESGQVRPLALDSNGARLYAVNTPDGRLEVFDVRNDGLVHLGSVPVGMEPVAVALRSDSEAWVVNHLSDSVSIVDLSSMPPRVVRTLHVGDEPRDIVFAGPQSSRAFITTAHRGQNSPYGLDQMPANPGELTTPGIGRADVWVFDADNPGADMGGTPITVLSLFGDTPRALTVSPDGGTVYAAIFHSGNQTTVLHEQAVCNGGAAAPPCNVSGATAPGGLPAPNADSSNAPQPEVGLIVRFDGTHWVDEFGRSWDELVRFDLPDQDVFAIDANANPPVQTDAYAHVGTVLYNMAVNPVSGKVYVANTEAVNHIRFEGSRPDSGVASNYSTVQGHQHETRISVIDPASGDVLPRHLNKHIDYSVSPAPAGVKEKSLALPRQIAVTGDGSTLYLAAKGSNKIGIFDTADLEDDSFVPDAASHITVSGGGPGGLVLDEGRGRLYVLTRFDNGISVIDTAAGSEIRHYGLHNPEPSSVVQGRPFLYDAMFTSSNGEAACASCHVDGNLDSLAWDLGDPTGTIQDNPLTFTLGPFNSPPSIYADFHPLKGPMTTQTLRGMATHGSMHWRGDRNNSADPMDAVTAFKEFNVAFEGLLGREGPIPDTDMQAFADFILQVQLPPNPIRALDDSLTPEQQAGRDLYFNRNVDTTTCNGCHTLDPSQGFFGTNGNASFEGETQHLKIPHLRNMYEKVGMFGMADVSFFLSGDNGHKGDQIRGFGFLHDGSTDNLFRFFRAGLFNFDNDTQRRNVEQFMFAFDSDIKPVVGQQVTLDENSTTAEQGRVSLLLARAAAGDADLVVKGVVDGLSRGWYRLPGGAFRPDNSVESDLTETQLRALAAEAGNVLTYTAVPVGSGERAGIDRDGDGVFDGDDNCPLHANATQSDQDGDLVGDACDNCQLVANADQIDTNGDGYGNMCDGDLNNDGSTNTLDLQVYKPHHRTVLERDPDYNPDADFNSDGRINTLDLQIYKGLHRKPPGPSCCGA